MAAKWRKTNGQDMLRQRDIANGAERGGDMVGGKGGRTEHHALPQLLRQSNISNLGQIPNSRGEVKGTDFL